MSCDAESNCGADEGKTGRDGAAESGGSDVVGWEDE